MTERPVVAGVDGSAPALRAVRWAAREARRRVVPLRLVHVNPELPGHVPPPPEYRTAIDEQATHWLDEARSAAADAAPGVTVTTAVRDGVPAEELTAESANAGLVVLGSRGLGGFSAMLVGSVAVALSAHAHCPVVVMHAPTADGEPPETGPVVVGTDVTDLSAAALTFAFEAAAARDVPLVVVHTWLDVTMRGAWTALPWAVDWHLVQTEEEKRLADGIAAWRDRYPGVVVRTVIVKDRPERALLEQAEGAQLVVVGSRGHTAPHGMGLGSVSRTLVRDAGCPVVVARPKAAAV